jgi:hypothetical protein
MVDQGAAEGPDLTEERSAFGGPNRVVTVALLFPDGSDVVLVTVALAMLVPVNVGGVVKVVLILRLAGGQNAEAQGRGGQAPLFETGW